MMATSKVEIMRDGQPETLIDLTGDTITEETAAEGTTFHDATGEQKAGKMPITNVLYTEQELTDAQKQQARTNIGAASAAAVSELSEQIANMGTVGGSGITVAQAESLWAMLKKTAYSDAVTDAERTSFKTAWGITEEDPEVPDTPTEPEVTLTSISTVYTGGDVTVGTAVTDLTGITVTATYSDGSTQTVTGYTLSGTIAEGSNTITVSYGGKTTTFTVTGVAESGGDEPEAVVYNVFDGEYENTGYGGTLQSQFGSNYDVYKTKIDVSDADRLYWRCAKVKRTARNKIDVAAFGVYSADDTFLGKIDLQNNSDIVVETYAEGEAIPNVGTAIMETLPDGKDVYAKVIGSVPLTNYPEKSYVLFAVRGSQTDISLIWEGNAQSTSPLTLEGWV